MESLSKYIFSIAAAAFLVGILGSLADKKGATSGVFRLIAGLFLTFMVISPIVRMDFSGITDFLESFSLEGASTAAWGESTAQEEYRTIIKSRVEAYILDKAEVLGAAVTVAVTLSDDDVPLPTDVVIRGTVSPYARTQLQQMMESDLGIAKENQIWIG